MFFVLSHLYHSLRITDNTNIINYSTYNDPNQLKILLEINYDLSIRNEISKKLIDIWKNIHKKALGRKNARFDNSVDNRNDKSTYDHLFNLHTE